MKKNMISIVVPFYKNNEESFKKCIESILSQEYNNFELLLIGDGANASLINIAEKYAKKYKKVRLHTKQNGGVSSARNYGIEVACGRYITFIDADDFVDSDYLYEIMKYKTQFGNEEILVGGSLKYIYRKSVRNELCREVVLPKEDFMLSIINGKIHGSACRFVYDAERIKKNNILFNEKISYMEDATFVYEYCIKADVKQVKILPAYYNYIKSNDSATNSKNSRDALNNIFRALSIMSRLTHYKYKNEINNCKIILMENKLATCSNKERIEIVKEFRNNINAEYSGNERKYKLFARALRGKSISMKLRTYYLLLNIARTVLGKKNVVEHKNEK